MKDYHNTVVSVAKVKLKSGHKQMETSFKNQVTFFLIKILILTLKNSSFFDYNNSSMYYSSFRTEKKIQKQTER